MIEHPLIVRDPEIMHGTPVFAGTRVPIQTLLDYLEDGDPLEEFLDDFPSVTREQATELIRLAGQVLLDETPEPPAENQIVNLEELAKQMVEANGKPISAAIIEKLSIDEREALFKLYLRARGLVRDRDTTNLPPPRMPRLIQAKGKPISEMIIEERR
jgi:uncharacterized protein (DUF433 family)